MTFLGEYYIAGTNNQSVAATNHDEWHVMGMDFVEYGYSREIDAVNDQSLRDSVVHTFSNDDEIQPAAFFVDANFDHIEIVLPCHQRIPYRLKAANVTLDFNNEDGHMSAVQTLGTKEEDNLMSFPQLDIAQQYLFGQDLSIPSWVDLIDAAPSIEQDMQSFMQDTEPSARPSPEQRQTAADNSIVDRPERHHQCSDCSASFQYPKDLARHQSTVHARARPFLCPATDCRYHVIGFGRQDNRARHIRNMHKDM